MGDPSDPIKNCALRVCCEEAQARIALAKFFVTHGMDERAAKQAADCTLEYFDLAEKGTLQPFKDSIARLARANAYGG